MTRLKIPRITTIKTTKTVTSGHTITQISNHVPQMKKMREEMGKEGRWVGGWEWLRTFRGDTMIWLRVIGEL